MTYVVGVDFGTLSARALVVRAADGAEMGSAVHEYPHAVMERTLASSGAELPPQWALQDPSDYVEALRQAVPAAVRAAGIRPDEVVGIATDFTASSPLPVLADGTPLCQAPGFEDRPHAYVKLWKHHAAQRQADRINALAAERGEPWLARYGGRISSEWEFAKVLQVLEEDPEVYERMDRWVEAADWIVWQLCGRETRNACTAGYKGIYQDGHYPSEDYLRALDERFADFVAAKLSPGIDALGARAGDLTARGRRLDGPAGGHRRGRRQRRCARDRAGGPGDRARPDADRHGHLELPRDERRAGGRGAGHVRRRRRRHRARVVGLRGRPDRRRRHLRLVHRERRPAPLPRRGAGPRAGPARVPVPAGRRAGGRRPRPGGARLEQRQPLGARGPRAQRADRRPHARHPGRGHLPRADRVDRVRHAHDPRDVRRSRRAGAGALRRRRPDQEPGGHADLLRRRAACRCT